MPVDDLRRSPMMNPLLDALERGEDIGHYGRLTFAMVARHFMDSEEVVRLLAHGGDTDERKARALVKQVEDHDYNPTAGGGVLFASEEGAIRRCGAVDGRGAQTTAAAWTRRRASGQPHESLDHSRCRYAG